MSCPHPHLPLAIAIAGDPGTLHGELPDVPTAPQEILDAFDLVPDPRKPRGRRHHLAGVLAAAAATIAGAASVAAIAEWAADAGADVLARLGIEARVPSLSTFHRVLRSIDAHRFDLSATE